MCLSSKRQNMVLLKLLEETFLFLHSMFLNLLGEGTVLETVHGVHQRGHHDDGEPGDLFYKISSVRGACQEV